MSTPPRVLAVCVNWNGAEVLPATLASLEAAEYPNLDVIVVDNASQDGSQDCVRPPARLLQLRENRGYAHALNRGLEEALDGPKTAPDYFLLMNNDLEVRPGLIGDLVELARAHGPGIFGPQVRLSEKPSRLEAAWGELSWDHVLARYNGRNQPADDAPWRHPRQVELLLGCILLMDRQVVLRVGAWDERFFMYHEEVDYLYRARLAGFPVYYCPGTWVLHRAGHGTRGRPLRKIYWVRRNTLYFFRKHHAGWKQWVKFGATLTASLIFNLATLRWRRLAAILRGVRDGCSDPK